MEEKVKPLQPFVDDEMDILVLLVVKCDVWGQLDQFAI